MSGSSGTPASREQRLDRVRLDRRAACARAGWRSSAARAPRSCASSASRNRPLQPSTWARKTVVALGAVLDAELHEAAAPGPDPAQDLGDHAVLAVLGEDPQLRGGQVGRIAVAPGELAERRIDAARAVGVLERALHERAERARLGGGADAVQEAHRRPPFHIAAASSPSAASRLTIQPARQLQGA